mgnify:CR=1 FL=1
MEEEIVDLKLGALLVGQRRMIPLPNRQLGVPDSEIGRKWVFILDKIASSGKNIL